MVAQSAILRALGTTRNAVNYWRAAGFITSALPPTSAGVPQELTRENALEIAFMAVLTASGVAAAKAAMIVPRWLQDEREGQLSPTAATRPGATYAVGGSSGLPTVEQIQVLKEVEEGAHNLGTGLIGSAVHTVVDLETIVNGVDALFAQHGERKRLAQAAPRQVRPRGRRR